MKKRILLSVVFLLMAAGSFADDVTGRWAGTIAGLYDITVNMKEQNGKVTGIVSSEIGDIPLSGGIISGSDITFKEFSYNGIAVTFIKGKLAGDKIDITVGFQGQNLQGTLKRLK
jgi:hypothetical protein